MKIKISDIIVDPGRRSIDPVKVNMLAESIKAIGLLNPIVVDKNNRLIAGAHRLMACKKLRWNSIKANIVELDGIKAAIAEIDENLVRSQMIVIEEALQLKHRKELYEQLYPVHTHGGDRRSKSRIIEWQRMPLDSPRTPQRRRV